MLGFANGDPVTVESRRGSTTLPAPVTTTIRPDTVFIPYHWAGPVSANRLTVDALDARSRIPEFKVCACRVRPGDRLDAVPSPPVPAGTEAYPDEVASLADPGAPTVPQGRGTGERAVSAEQED